MNEQYLPFKLKTRLFFFLIRFPITAFFILLFAIIGFSIIPNLLTGIILLCPLCLWLNLWGHLVWGIGVVPLLFLFGIKKKAKNIKLIYSSRRCLYKDKEIGLLLYEKIQGHDMPVLHLKTKDPYLMGYAEGYLLGKELEKLIYQVFKPMFFLCRFLKKDISRKYGSKQNQCMHFPADSLKIFEGLYAGLLQYAKETGHKLHISLDLLYSANCFMDIYKAIGTKNIITKHFFNSWGCSLLAIKKPNKMVVGRTVEWPSLGMLGKYFLIKKYSKNGFPIEIQGLPGLIGALSAKNNHLVLLVNESGNVSKGGVPYLIYARYLIEKCESVAEIKKYIDTHPLKPASSHNLTAVDKSTASVFQFYTNDHEIYSLRTLGPENYLIVTNHGLDKENNYIPGSISNITSKKRFRLLEKIYKEFSSDFSSGQMIIYALKQTNNLETIAASLYTFCETTIKVQYVHDNFFAAGHLKSL